MLQKIIEYLREKKFDELLDLGVCSVSIAKSGKDAFFSLRDLPLSFPIDQFYSVEYQDQFHYRYQLNDMKITIVGKKDDWKKWFSAREDAIAATREEAIA